MTEDVARRLMLIWEASREALEEMGVVRSRNVVGDYAEHLVCTHLGVEPSGSKIAPHDAVDAAGLRYQVKARCRNEVSGTVFAGIKPDNFDLLVLVVFGRDYHPAFAGRVKADDVKRLQGRAGNVVLTEAVLADPALEDITELLR